MSVESTKEVMMGYLSADHADTSMLADDVVFSIMATGQKHETPEGVQGMLNYFYHVAFEAMAFAFPCSVLLITNCGYLSVAGLPTPPIFFLSLIMVSCWVVGLLLAVKRYR